MNQKLSIPWPRILVEGVVIVASILLALAGDAWWDGRQQREQETVILEALKSEIQSNLLAIDTERPYRAATLESATELLNVLSGNKEVDSDEMDRLLNSLVWWGEAQWSTGALIGLIEGGGLALIQDVNLRSMIASLPEVIETVKNTESEELITFRTAIMPFLYESTLVSQINNAQLTRPGVGDWQQPLLPVGELQDHSSLVGDTRLIGIVTKRVWDHSDVINAYEIAQATMEELIEAIDGAISN